jgi:Uma2 family endonuclease
MTLDYTRRWISDSRAYVIGALSFYYSSRQATDLDFKAPDIMVFLDVERRVRKSWVVWEEDGKRPDLVIELLSETTRNNDLGRKKNVYERLGVRDYFAYDPFTAELWGWTLEGGGYLPLTPDRDGCLECASLGVKVGVVGGLYAGVRGPWLRFFGPDGEVIPTHAEAEARRAEAEARRAEAAERELVELRRLLAERSGS